MVDGVLGLDFPNPVLAEPEPERRSLLLCRLRAGCWLGSRVTPCPGPGFSASCFNQNQAAASMMSMENEARQRPRTPPPPPLRLACPCFKPCSPFLPLPLCPPHKLQMLSRGLHMDMRCGAKAPGTRSCGCGVACCMVVPGRKQGPWLSFCSRSRILERGVYSDNNSFYVVPKQRHDGCLPPATMAALRPQHHWRH